MSERPAARAMTSGGAIAKSAATRAPFRHCKSPPSSSLRGAKRRGNPVRSGRRAATLIKKAGGGKNARPSPAAKKSAALRAGWNSALSRPSGTLPRQAGEGNPLGERGGRRTGSIWPGAGGVWLDIESIWLGAGEIWLDVESIWLGARRIWLDVESIWLGARGIWLDVESIWPGARSTRSGARFRSAALRAGWNELDCHGPAALAMTGGGGPRRAGRGAPRAAGGPGGGGGHRPPASWRGPPPRGNPDGLAGCRGAAEGRGAAWIAAPNVYSSRNSLINKEYNVIPALGMDTIMDFFPFAGKPDSCSCGLPLSA
jgi:hypothetical protein